MRFSKRWRQCVGYIVADRPNGSKAIGTFFLLQHEMAGWSGEPDRTIVRWMVTAAHVIADEQNLRARMWDNDGSVQEWNVDDGWICPSGSPGERIDLAVRVFNENDHDGYFIALPEDYDIANAGRGLELAQPVYFPGLLAWSTDARPGLSQPVVRSGSVAALSERDVKWNKKGNWTAPVVDLVDVRSFGGFSGSPCFVQFLVADLNAVNVGAFQRKLAKQAGRDPSALTEVTTFTHWSGMFAAHECESGIGIAIPAEEIRNIMNNDEAIQEARETEETRIDELPTDKRGPIGQAADTTSTESQFLADLAKATRPLPSDLEA